MALNIKLEAFEGPFDLLFHLIEENQIDIYDIPIAELTDQYLSYLKNINEEQLDTASEFLVMAATLLSIKSKMLLPKQEDKQVQLELSAAEDEEDPRDVLVSRLVEYKKFKAISLELKKREEEQALILKKKPEDLSHIWPEDFVLSDLTLDDLINAFVSLLSKEKPRDETYHVSQDPLPLPIRIKELYKLLKELKKKVFFSQLFGDEASKSEVIVTFLAVLELVKRNKILAAQDRMFGEIALTYRGDQ